MLGPFAKRSSGHGDHGMNSAAQIRDLSRATDVCNKRLARGLERRTLHSLLILLPIFSK